MKVPASVRFVILLTSIIFTEMLVRAILSPLLMSIQSEFGISLAQAGSIFLIIYIGYSPAMLLSGYISARIRHKGSAVFALLLTALGLTIAALAPSFGVFQAGFFLVGAGCGIYPPSAIGTLTEVVSPQRRGLALSIHEIGPNSALLVAPLIVLFLYSRLGWRGILLILVVLVLTSAFGWARQNIGGNTYGQAPRFNRLKAVVKLKEAWFILILFIAAHCALQGLFAILPMYLVVTRGLEAEMVYKLISASRISSIVLLPISGTLVDIFGARKVILTVFTVSGLATIFIGLTSGFALTLAVIIQPALITAFYPAALSIITRLGPEESRNVTFSVIISIAVFVGAGVFPTFFGWLGDLGIQFVGLFVLAGILLVSAFCVYKNRGFGGKFVDSPGNVNE